MFQYLWENHCPNDEDGQSKCLIFTKTRKGCQKLSVKLGKEGFNCFGIHAGLEMEDRMNIVNLVMKGRVRVLVCTDILCRGMDIPQVECVINYDIPDIPGDFIHRAGRTGRAGKEGICLTYIPGTPHGRLNSLLHHLRENNISYPRWMEERLQ